MTEKDLEARALAAWTLDDDDLFAAAVLRLLADKRKLHAWIESRLAPLERAEERGNAIAAGTRAMLEVVLRIIDGEEPPP